MFIKIKYNKNHILNIIKSKFIKLTPFVFQIYNNK